GSVGTCTRVSAYATEIDSILDRPYDLGWNMKHQPGGRDNRDDVFEARLNGANLELLVNGEVVHTDAVAKIRSLAITGSPDNDRFIIPGNLGIKVTIDSALGRNQLTVDAAGSDFIDVESKAIKLGIEDPFGRPMVTETIGYTTEVNDVVSISADTGIGGAVINVASTFCRVDIRGGRTANVGQNR